MTGHILFSVWFDLARDSCFEVIYDSIYAVASFLIKLQVTGYALEILKTWRIFWSSFLRKVTSVILQRVIARSAKNNLTHYSQVLLIYTPWKNKKT